ncbi:MAG TPA: glycosyltransferase family 4 protein [Parcubacteria group bacterium]|nr:glycosyltransferase family 4 protein [Parcubacteria group bacterium]
MKTKICFLITKGTWGGAQRYVYNLAVNLPSNKYDVLVITGSGEILRDKLREKGVRAFEINNLKRDVSLLSEIKSFIKILKILHNEKPDVLHLNSPKASGLGSLAGKLLGVKKIIQTVHGWSFNEDRNIFSKSLIYIFSNITTILCDKTIVIAKKEKNQALKMPFVNDEKIVLIRNGVEKLDYINKTIVREALINRTDGKVREHINSKTLWIGTVSELHNNKGLEYMINSLSKIKSNFVFFIIGEGEERKKLHKLIRQKGLENKVFLVGFIDIANLYLKAFDIFTLTSKKEGLPYAVLEAGGAGVCVLASNVGGIPDIIDHNRNGLLVSVGNEKEIQKNIEFLETNTHRRAELGKNLKQKIDKEFSIDQMLKKTFLLYK